jgi:uncharacterized membrane protein YbhN (UPF0104 family)
MYKRAMPNPAPEPTARAVPWWRRALAWGLALGALAFVVAVVPVRERCEEPVAAGAASAVGAKRPKYRVERDATGCTLAEPQGAVHIDPADCEKLACEPGLVSTVEHARVGELVFLLAVYMFGTFVWSARWRALLRLAGVPLGLLETWRVTLESQAGGILLPGGVGGDALRVGFVVARGGSVPRVIAAVVLDRFLGLSALAALAAGFAFIFGGGALGPAATFLALIPVGVAVGLLFLRWPPVRAFAHARAERIAGPVLDYVAAPGAPRAILVGAALALVVASTQMVVIRGLVHALGATPPVERWIYIGATMSFITGSIPALPGGWGTADAAYVFFFEKAGLAASVALTVSLLYRLFWYFSGGSGAVLYLLRSHAASKVPSARPVPLVAGEEAGERKV